jgi:FkbM family methyltransferase
MEVVFTNDNNVRVIVPPHRYSRLMAQRDNHEVLFRRIHSYLFKQGVIAGNVIDLGAWIGDNTVPWAKQTSAIIYAIDPSPKNCRYIQQVAAMNSISNVRIIQKAISDTSTRLYTTDNLHHCSFVYNKAPEGWGQGVEAVSLDSLFEAQEIANIGFIHLDVEGMEAAVVKGAEKLIHDLRPLVTFEQHLDLDDYKGLSAEFVKKDYRVFMINEVLPGCRPDCRNFIAFPSEKLADTLLTDIHNHIGFACLEPTL